MASIDLNSPATHPSIGWGSTTPSNLSINSSTLAAQIADKIKANNLAWDNADLTSFETKKKVDNVKQKLYVFGLAVIGWLMFSYMNASFEQYTQKETEIQTLNNKITEVTAKIQWYKSNEDILRQLTRESDINEIIRCINNSNLCENVPQALRKDLSVTRAYLLMTPLSDDKMEVDQKAVLKHFNEYLLLNDNGTRLWQLLNISFTEPQMVDSEKQIYKIAVDTTITFPNKDALMAMIQKIESWINPNSPLLIKIETVNYDIVKFEEAQTINISFAIYQYKK